MPGVPHSAYDPSLSLCRPRSLKYVYPVTPPMSEYVAGRLMEPLLTLKLLEQMRSAVRSGSSAVACSLDLQRSTTSLPRSTSTSWEVPVRNGQLLCAKSHVASLHLRFTSTRSILKRTRSVVLWLAGATARKSNKDLETS